MMWELNVSFFPQPLRVLAWYFQSAGQVIAINSFSIIDLGFDLFHYLLCLLCTYIQTWQSLHKTLMYNASLNPSYKRPIITSHV